MIVWHHPSQTPVTPPCLEGFDPIPGSQVMRRDSEAGHFVAIGDPLYFELPPERAFKPTGDGWGVALQGRLEPQLLFRRPTWIQSVPLADLSGRVWMSPIVLNDNGEREFLVNFGGKDFLPVLTETQSQCLGIARAARLAIPGGLEVSKVACHWAAVLLAVTNAISVEAMAELNILDAGLVAQVLSNACGLQAKFEPEA